MKINSISNKQSFGALMLENKEISGRQKLLVANAINSILEHKSFLRLLENKYTDVYISPNDDKKTVDVKLLSAAGYTYNYVPVDEKGEMKIKLHIPVSDPKKWNVERICKNTDIRLGRFINRCIDALYAPVENPENTQKRYSLENISISDRDAKDLQLEKLLPDAESIYGNPQVTTKDFLKYS